MHHTLACILLPQEGLGLGAASTEPAQVLQVTVLGLQG